MKLLTILFLALLLCRAGPAEETTVSLTHAVTAYCPCEKCCGQWANKREGKVVGAYGIELQQGVSVAAPYPCGTVLEIEGLGEFTVHDKTADWIVERYHGRIVDVFFETHEEAVRFGKRTLQVRVIE